ncbi:alpha/beta hydrolase [Brevibacillus humidisoli]|uniref:alpha/beta fold hydrolase n=1 Tax=Brevibacillus humidisoli TaxID=2895522 RepID=UPI001E536824|nr:alpha/beta hydrolase [Brevibacillus humidisoli]UFJ41302.1 alpha/beta hydrolase [Brevibacillus humidisoli]
MYGLIGLGILVVVFAALYGINQLKIKQTEEKVPPLGRFLECDGIKLHYIRKGTGTPVVFLHGGILSVHDYIEAVELVSQNYQAIAFDRPGYGYSERPGTGQATPADQARLLHGALQQLGIEKPVLVGHSWSGSLVLAYALAYPDELSGMVLLAPGAYGGEAYPAGVADIILSRIVTAPLVGDMLVHTVLPLLGRIIVKRLVRATFAPDPVPADYLRVAEALWPRPLQLKANREDILTFSPAVEAISKRYGQISLPTVIVIGEDDPFNPHLQAYPLHEAIPHSHLLVLPDVAHMIPKIRPDAILQALAYLERSRKSTTGNPP